MLWIRIRMDPHRFWSAGSWFRRAKIIHTQKKKEVKKFHVLKCWVFFFWGLKASPVAWTSFTEAEGSMNCSFFTCVDFFIFGHQNPWHKILDPDPHWNQCGSIKCRIWIRIETCAAPHATTLNTNFYKSLFLLGGNEQAAGIEGPAIGC